MKGNEMRPPGMASQGQVLERRVDGNHSQRALTVGIAFLGEIARSVAGLANCECAAAAGTATLGQGSKGAGSSHPRSLSQPPVGLTAQRPAFATRFTGVFTRENTIGLLKQQPSPSF
jgi:hypothetical protein